MAAAISTIRGRVPLGQLTCSISCLRSTPATTFSRSYYSQTQSSTLPRSTRPSPRPSHASQSSSHTRSHQYSSSSSSSSSSSKPPRSNDNATMADKPEPTGCIAKDGIELFTLGTPNGVKVSIALEELKEAYGDKAPKYTWQVLDISKNTQKQPWFTEICPNGRIPAIVDHDRGDFPVFEGLAILSYLTKHYDPDNKISFPYESDDHSVAEQWMSWQHGGVGPMQGQANHFLRAAKEKIPYAAQRYVGEAERLYGILDARLKDRDFVAGPGRGKFSIADISLLGWANVAVFATLDLPGLFPNVVAWIDRCSERPGVQRGFAVPQPSGITNRALEKRIQEDPELKAKTEELRKFVDEAKAQYGYKYASP